MAWRVATSMSAAPETPPKTRRPQLMVSPVKTPTTAGKRSSTVDAAERVMEVLGSPAGTPSKKPAPWMVKKAARELAEVKG